MGVSVLHPLDCLNDPFSRNSRQNKPVPNRRRRSPPRHQPASSSPPPLPPSPPVSTFIPKGSKKKNLNQTNNVVSTDVRILKRGDEIPDLKPGRQIRSDPVKIPKTQIRISDRKPTPALFYAGPVTSTSPPPSEVPLPAFFAKRNVSELKPADATNDLIRILRLDIA